MRHLSTQSQSVPVVEFFQGSLLAHRELWQVVTKNRYQKTCFLADAGSNPKLKALLRHIGQQYTRRGWSVFTWNPINGVRASGSGQYKTL